VVVVVVLVVLVGTSHAPLLVLAAWHAQGPRCFVFK